MQSILDFDSARHSSERYSIAFRLTVRKILTIITLLSKKSITVNIGYIDIFHISTHRAGHVAYVLYRENISYIDIRLYRHFWPVPGVSKYTALTVTPLFIVK